MNTLINTTGFDANLVSAPWYSWQNPSDGVGVALQAMKVTAVNLSEQGWKDDDVRWDEFCQQLDAVFQGWRDNAITQRLLQAALFVEREYPLKLTDEQWLESGQITVDAVGGWWHDTSELTHLAAGLGVDPVQIGWVAGAEQPGAAAVTQHDVAVFPQDFSRYVDYYVSAGHGLPDAATIESWFSRQILPEAILARFLSDFPNGVKAPTGIISIDQIGEFYLGAEAWAATNLLQDEDMDPELVQEILDYFISDEPLTEAQMLRVKEAIDTGVITIEDDD